jgi:hypothetical protein
MAHPKIKIAISVNFCRNPADEYIVGEAKTGSVDVDVDVKS